MKEIIIKEDWKGEAIIAIVNKLSRGYAEDVALCKTLIDNILQTPTKIELVTPHPTKK